MRALLLVEVTDHDFVLDLPEKLAFGAVRRSATDGCRATPRWRVPDIEAILRRRSWWWSECWRGHVVMLGAAW